MARMIASEALLVTGQIQLSDVRRCLAVSAACTQRHYEPQIFYVTRAHI
jgi:hypothetical protein